MPKRDKSVRPSSRPHKVTLALPPDLARAVRHLAAERTEPGQRVTVNGLITEAVQRFLDNG